MNESFRIPRRTFLRGIGTAIALPLLDAMRPAGAFAAAVGAPKTPVRMAFMFVPNGAHMPDWTPQATGADFDLPYILQPLQAHKDELLVMTGLTQDHGRANGDGAGDHARAAGSWLTGAQPLKSEGAQIRAGISADQAAAQAIGKETRFGSLELGMEPGRLGGKCDSGYSCAYSNNISWRSENTPGGREINPREVFERFFSNGVSKEVDESQKRRELYKKSILDFVLEDASALSGKVGGHDKQKLDEYLTAVREIELRVQQAEQQVAAVNSGVVTDYEIPEGIPESYEEHARLMLDMMVLAFQTDTTRIATMMLANEGSNRPYRNLEHHARAPRIVASPEQSRQLPADPRDQQIPHPAVCVFAEQAALDPGGRRQPARSLDDPFRRGLADGNRHEHENLPLVHGGPWGRNGLAGAACALCDRDADVQSAHLDDGARGCADLAVRRQHGCAARAGCIIICRKATCMRLARRRVVKLG